METKLTLAQSDKMGKMVHEDVKLDFNGFPKEIPAVYWMRSPTIKVMPNSYEDWKRRKGTPYRLLEATGHAIAKLEHEVGRIMWEMKLEKRTPTDHKTFAFNNKLIEMLGGIIYQEKLTDGRITR